MDTAEQDYRSMMNLSKQFLKVIKDMLDSFMDLLMNRSRFAAQIAFAKAIKNGEVVSYKVYGDVMDGMIERLKEANIAFEPLINNNSILVRMKDVEKIKAINRELNIAAGNYYQVVDALEMENAYAINCPNNCEMFELSNLNYLEKEIMVQKMNDISEGYMVGVRQNSDDSFNLVVHSPKVYSPNLETKDFCKTYLEAMVGLYGGAGDVKKDRVDYDLSFYNKVNDILNNDCCSYIVDVQNTGKYIEIDDRGFSLYKSTIAENENHELSIVTDKIFGIDKDDINFDGELRRVLDTFRNKTILTSHDELFKHISNPNQNFDCDRPTYTATERLIHMNERNIISLIDESIKKKMSDKSFDPYSAFDYYRGEMKEIFNCISKGVDVKGYDEEFNTKLKGYLKASEVDVKVYKKIVDKETNLHSSMHKAKKKTINRGEELT